ncbi:hypothetical protein B0T16DRAFT_176872 [Cercophora newfieldiana]|uniref:Uncharacterized protein n=1 Tax=Cercophora newfieldiana TaxID=92897 RepID=A0AA39Y0D7_9PEZI|nr:hypothetical protein B0T16DRAFT_176872 [Cercophora newfieldiana]
MGIGLPLADPKLRNSGRSYRNPHRPFAQSASGASTRDKQAVKTTTTTSQPHQADSHLPVPGRVESRFSSKAAAKLAPSEVPSAARLFPVRSARHLLSSSSVAKGNFPQLLRCTASVLFCSPAALWCLNMERAQSQGGPKRGRSKTAGAQSHCLPTRYPDQVTGV